MSDNVSSTIEQMNVALTGRYEIERELGAGGMATVYLARDVRHDREVAIKVLHPDLGAALGADRFLAEIKTTAKLQHPHILPLLDSGSADGWLYYVMPVVTGESLRERLTRERQLPLADAVRIAREVAGALDYAHRHGVIHRDIKPENILLHDGSAIVADFGIALAVQTASGPRMTQTGLSLGTPQYMSPEQAMGERQIDARADVYALGAVTYEMVTGDPPFTGSSVQAIVAKVLTERPTPPSVTRDTVPSNVEHAVMTALAKLPADRFATAAEFSTALVTAQPVDAGNAVGTSAMRAVPRPTGRLAYVGWGVAALLAVGLGASLFRHRTSDTHSVLVQRQITYTGDVTAVGLSPDGLWIAYLRDDCATHDLPACTSTLEVREVDGTQSVKIGTWPNVAPDLRWTGDNRVVFRAGAATGPTAILISDRLGGTSRRIPVEASAMAVLGDGHTLVAAVGPPTRQWLRRYDLASLALLDSAPLPPNVELRDLSVSPGDGTLAAFAALGGFNTAIALLDAGGRMLDTMALSSRQVVRWDSGGTAVLVFDDAESGGLGEDLLRLPVAHRRFVRVRPTPVVGQLSTGETGGMDVARTERLVLLFGPMNEAMEVGSPTPGSAWQIVRAASGAFLGGRRMSFTPDGRGVVGGMSDNLGENLYVLPLDRSPPHPLTAYAGWATTGGRWAQDAVYSPNGTRLVFSRGNARDVDVVMTDSSGGRDRVLAPGGSINATWSPDWISDDRVVIYRNGAFVVVDTSGVPRDSVAVPDSLAFSQGNFRARAAESTVYFWSAPGRALASADFRTHRVSVVTRSQRAALHPVGWDAAGALLGTETDLEHALAPRTLQTALFRIGADGSVTPLGTAPAGCIVRGVERSGRMIVCTRVERMRDVWLAVGR